MVQEDKLMGIKTHQIEGRKEVESLEMDINEIFFIELSSDLRYYEVCIGGDVPILLRSTCVLFFRNGRLIIK